MKNLLLKLLAVFSAWTCILVVLKLIFIGVNFMLISPSCYDLAQIIGHGLPMDLCVAGYLSVIPFLLTVVSIWSQSRVIDLLASIYFVVVSCLIALITVFDMGLFEAWKFRLDVTPIFYITSSPTAAAASLFWWQWIGGTTAFLAISAAIWWLMSRKIWSISILPKSRIAQTITALLLSALLFLPIRGGVGVSTMNPGNAFFSPNPQFNQAALNPAFNLLYSATHQSRFDRQFRFMSDNEAAAIINPKDSIKYKPIDIALSSSNPDIWLIILESFSTHLMPSLGGDSVAVRLDSIAKNSISFTEFYASSFRTDRALPAILCGFPAQPTTSIIKFTDKTAKLPSIARVLNQSGYNSSYYYGGDVNFTNMNAFLVNAGFSDITSDVDFPKSLRTSKWGVHDQYLFDRALKDASDGSGSPHFRVIQTSSSHEPFAVPYASPRFRPNTPCNAFAYTDKCVADFIDSLSASPSWSNTLVFITADHQGAWPDCKDMRDKQHVPFIITGGAIASSPQSIGRIIAQTDIPSIILSLTGKDDSDFFFSNNQLGTAPRPYAFFSGVNIAGVVTPEGTYSLDTSAAEHDSQSMPQNKADLIKAYLQILYNKLSN